MTEIIILIILIIIVVGVVLFIMYTDTGKNLAKQYLPSSILSMLNIGQSFSSDPSQAKKEQKLIELILRADLIPNNAKDAFISKIKTSSVTKDEVTSFLNQYMSPEVTAKYLSMCESQDGIVPYPSNVNDPVVRQPLLNYHMQTSDSVDTRDVSPFGEHLNGPGDPFDKGTINDIIGTVRNDSPAINNNNQYIPGFTTTEIKSIPSNSVIAARLEYNKKPKSQTFDRHGDIRPLPDSQINMILSNNGGKDPNSLRGSLIISPSDALHSGRGAFGNTYLDSAIDKIVNTEINTDTKKIWETVDEKVQHTNSIKDINGNNLLINQLISETKSPTEFRYGSEYIKTF